MRDPGCEVGHVNELWELRYLQFEKLSHKKYLVLCNHLMVFCVYSDLGEVCWRQRPCICYAKISRSSWLCSHSCWSVNQVGISSQITIMWSNNNNNNYHGVSTIHNARCGNEPTVAQQMHNYMYRINRCLKFDQPNQNLPCELIIIITRLALQGGKTNQILCYD